MCTQRVLWRRSLKKQSSSGRWCSIISTSCHLHRCQDKARVRLANISHELCHVLERTLHFYRHIKLLATDVPLCSAPITTTDPQKSANSRALTSTCRRWRFRFCSLMYASFEDHPLNTLSPSAVASTPSPICATFAVSYLSRANSCLLPLFLLCSLLGPCDVDVENDAFDLWAGEYHLFSFEFHERAILWFPFSGVLDLSLEC